MTSLFSKEARCYFDPIATNFDMTCVSKTDFEIKYENKKVFLSINFDYARSYELEVNIGQKNTNHVGPPFSLSEILRLQGEKDTHSNIGTMIGNQSELPSALERLAKLTSRYASNFLSGSDNSFKQIENMRNMESSYLEIKSKLENMKLAAEKAWQEKAYKEVILALEPLEQYLSDIEKGKLAYARNKISKI